MDKALSEELNQKFEKMKKELGFKASFEDLNSIFFLKDMVDQQRFVSETLSRQICGRIVDTYYSWSQYLHRLIFVAPGDIIGGTENKSLSEQDKKEAWSLMRGIMELASRNSPIGINKNKKDEAQFIDDAVSYWKNTFKPKILGILEKANKAWK